MIQLLGSTEIIKTLLVLTADEQGKLATNLQELRERYLRLLQNIHPEKYRKNFQDNNNVNFVTDKNLIADNVEIFNCESDLNDIANTIENYSKELEQNYRWYQNVLTDSKEVYPEFLQIFNLTVASVFNARSKNAGGGTTSACIGVIWCDNRPNWTAVDQLEFFIHELTHTLLFLDERRFVHYKNLDDIVKDENYAYSAILCAKRPLDKVVHSIVVATEILLVRDAFLGHEHQFKLHPNSATMQRKTLDSIADALNFSHMLTARTIELLHICKDRLLKMRISHETAL